MEHYEFFIQGSADEPYRVQFRRERGKIIGLCNCPAGENGLYCKHRFGILAGDRKICAEQDTEAVAAVRSWLPGSDLERAMQEVDAAEEEVTRAQSKVKTLKKRLARVLYGQA